MKANSKYLALTGLCLALSGAAQAQVVFDLNTLTNGNTPAGDAPWLRATFQNDGANTVKLTMENFLSSGEFVRFWGFNVEDSFIASLSASYVSGQTATFSKGNNFTNIQASTQAGLFDLLFEFPNAPPGQRFIGGETSVYKFTATGLTEDDFKVLSFPHPTNGSFYSAARLQGLPNDEGPNEGSGSIGAPIPEPAFYQMSGLLLLGGAGMFLRARRSRKNEA